MGKVRGLRARVHQAAVRPKGEAAPGPAPPAPEATPPPASAAGKDWAFINTNIFARTKIDPSALVQKLELDVRSVTSVRRGAEAKTVLPKKEKMKLRREQWLQKIEAIKLAEQKHREERRRRATVVVGDLHPLRDALPELLGLEAGSRRQARRKQGLCAVSNLGSILSWPSCPGLRVAGHALQAQAAPGWHPVAEAPEHWVQNRSGRPEWRCDNRTFLVLGQKCDPGQDPSRIPRDIQMSRLPRPLLAQGEQQAPALRAQPDERSPETAASRGRKDPVSGAAGQSGLQSQPPGGHRADAGPADAAGRWRPALTRAAGMPQLLRTRVGQVESAGPSRTMA
nr:ribosome biogenesis protein SLX9 homolog isoform X3 [Pan paniscus]